MKRYTLALIVVLIGFMAACSTNNKSANTGVAPGKTQTSATHLSDKFVPLSQIVADQVLDPVNRSKFTSYEKGYGSLIAKFTRNGTNYEITYMDGRVGKIVIRTTDLSGKFVVIDEDLDGLVDAGWYADSKKSKDAIPSLGFQDFKDLNDREKYDKQSNSPWNQKLMTANVEIAAYLAVKK